MIAVTLNSNLGYNCYMDARKYCIDTFGKPVLADVPTAGIQANLNESHVYEFFNIIKENT